MKAIFKKTELKNNIMLRDCSYERIKHTNIQNDEQKCLTKSVCRGSPVLLNKKDVTCLQAGSVNHDHTPLDQ